MMRILISGGGGKTGRAVARQLTAAGVIVRGFGRRRHDRFAGSEWVAGEITDAAAWREALAGVDRLYHICPNMHPAEVEIGQIALAAAAAAGIGRFVYHSVLHPQTEEMPHHWQKLRTEEALFGSGLPFVILQPAVYMQNLQPQWPAVLARGELVLPYPAETALSLVDLRDVAAAAARVLLEPGFEGGTFELAGTWPLTQLAVAAELSQVAGRPVRVVEQPWAEWESGVQNLPAYARESLLKMFRYYAAHGLVGNPTVLTHLLGRAPATLAACAAGWPRPGA